MTATITETIHFTVRSTQMYTMTEALVRERIQEQHRRARFYRQSEQARALRRWHRLEKLAQSARERAID